MHRSGTARSFAGSRRWASISATTFSAAHPENQTGYWEDKGIVGLNEWVLHSLHSNWDDPAPIERRDIESWRLWKQRRAARQVRRAHVPEGTAMGL